MYGNGDKNENCHLLSLYQPVFHRSALIVDVSSNYPIVIVIRVWGLPLKYEQVRSGGLLAICVNENSTRSQIVVHG